MKQKTYNKAKSQFSDGLVILRKKRAQKTKTNNEKKNTMTDAAGTKR